MMSKKDTHHTSRLRGPIVEDPRVEEIRVSTREGCREPSGQSFRRWRGVAVMGDRTVWKEWESVPVRAPDWALLGVF